MLKSISLFHPNSLLGRYVLVSTIIFVILVIIATLGWYTVQQGVYQHHRHMKSLTNLEIATQKYNLDYQGVKYATLEFLIQPDDIQLTQYKTSYKKFINSFKMLDLSRKKIPDDEIKFHFVNLMVNKNLLAVELKTLIDVRQNAEQTFPFTSNMLVLANANAEILAFIDRVVSPKLNQDENISEDIKLLFTDTRYGWVRLMAEYRLLVSVRFGIFTGDWRHAYNQRVYNISLLVDDINANLKKLRIHQLNKKLPFVIDYEITQLYQLTENSLGSYQNAISLLSTPNWRKDLVLLRDKLRPAFSKLDESILLLREEEEKVWSTSMEELTTIAQSLSYALWFLLFVCSFLVVLGYFMFSRAILQPIQNIAQTFKNEATGKITELKKFSSATEIRNLTDAFHDMRKQANSRKLRLTTILDNAAEAIITIDNNGTVETFNTAAEQLFGYHSSEVLGENVLMLISQNEREYYQKLFLKYQHINSYRHELEGENGYEIEILGKQQKLLPVSIKISKTIIDGKSFYTALVVDLTERRENELERQQHLTEMAHIGRLSIMGEMAAGMAHELNQPLAAMSLYLQGSLRSCDPESDVCQDIITAVHSAIEQVDRASIIIRTMRGFVHRGSFKLDVIDINELIKKSVEFVLFSQQSINPQPTFLLSHFPIMVNVDALQIEQVLVNLIRNAFDAQSTIVPSKRILKIRTEIDDAGLANVTVIDEGEGVLPENVDKIFNTYFTTKVDGLGMGLSICRSIIEEHNGMLWYKPGVQRGSQFCFTLPVAKTQK